MFINCFFLLDLRTLFLRFHSFICYQQQQTMSLSKRLIFFECVFLLLFWKKIYTRLPFFFFTFYFFIVWLRFCWSFRMDSFNMQLFNQKGKLYNAMSDSVRSNLQHYSRKKKLKAKWTVLIYTEMGDCKNNRQNIRNATCQLFSLTFRSCFR